MTLKELSDALLLLLKDGDKDDEPVCLETPRGSYEVDGLFVAVQSDNWVPETIVLTVQEVEATEDS